MSEELNAPPTTAQVVTPELKPCPFCGLQPITWTNAAKTTYVRCDTTGCVIGIVGNDIRLDQWNRRAAASLPNTRTPEGEPFREHVIRVMADVMGECRIARDSTKGSMFEQVADELRFARMQVATLLEKLNSAAPSSAPQEPTFAAASYEIPLERRLEAATMDFHHPRLGIHSTGHHTIPLTTAEAHRLLALYLAAPPALPANDFAKVYAGAILKVIPAEWWGTRAMDGAHLGNYLAEYVEELRAASLPSSPTPIRCPICDGRGVVAYPPNTVAGQGWSSSSTGNYSCPLCKGALIVQPSALPSRPTAPPLQNSPALQRAFDRLTKLATATGSGPVTIDHTDVSDLVMILGAIAAYGLKDPDNAALPASAEQPT